LVPPLLYADEPDSDNEDDDEPSNGHKDNDDTSQHQEEIQQTFHAIVEEIIQKADEYSRQKNPARSNNTDSRTTDRECADYVYRLVTHILSDPWYGKDRVKVPKLHDFKAA
jgi:hypothetical protein